MKDLLSFVFVASWLLLWPLLLSWCGVLLMFAWFFMCDRFFGAR